MEQAKVWRTGDLELLRAFYVAHTFPRHTHEFYVVGVVEQGVEAFFNKTQMHYAKYGDISLTNPDEIHTGHAGTSQGYLYRAFYPTVELLRDIAEDISGKEQGIPFFPKAVAPDREVSKVLLETHHLLEENASPLEQAETLRKAFGLLLLRHADTTLQPRSVYTDSHLVTKIRNYLHEHATDNITLEQLSSLVNVTPSYVSRVFKKTLGLPPHEYQTQLRVNHAKSLLQKGTTPADVALEAGFYDQSHLNKHFKRLVGVTAYQYQRAVAPL
jgi:AraC-like DNA-binding protein